MVLHVAVRSLSMAHDVTCAASSRELKPGTTLDHWPGVTAAGRRAATTWSRARRSGDAHGPSSSFDAFAHASRPKRRSWWRGQTRHVITDGHGHGVAGSVISTTARPA